MPILLHRADLPTPDMAWIVTPTALVLVADKRVPLGTIVQSLSLALAWIDTRTHPDPPHARSTAA